jgi:hypothetical protein
MNWKIKENEVVRTYVRSDLQNGLLKAGDLIEINGGIGLVCSVRLLSNPKITVSLYNPESVIVNGLYVAMPVEGVAKGYLSNRYKYIGKLVKQED